MHGFVHFAAFYAGLAYLCIFETVLRYNTVNKGAKARIWGKQRIACGKERRPKEARCRTAVRAPTRAFPYIRIEQNGRIRGAGQASSLRSSKTGDVFMRVNRMVAVRSARSGSPRPGAGIHFVEIPRVAPARASAPKETSYMKSRAKP